PRNPVRAGRRRCRPAALPDPRLRPRMSLILEALRKSEAERRRGEAPDLRVELPPPPPPKPGILRAAWLAGGLAVAVLAVAALWPRAEQRDAAGEGSEPDRLQRAVADERQAPV